MLRLAFKQLEGGCDIISLDFAQEMLTNIPSLSSKSKISELRENLIAQREAGEAPTVIARNFGMARGTIYIIEKLHKANGRICQVKAK